jgi:mannosyltransferase OCH1-like enzyme
MLYLSTTETFYDFKNLPDTYKQIEDINVSPSGKVPKIIHRICPKKKSEWHASWHLGYESWLKVFPQPEYTHMLWFDDELEEVIKNDGFEWFLPTFQSYNVNIKRIDMVRPFILYKYGGIYGDMDYMIFKNFYDELDPDRVSLCESPFKGNEDITNALMSSPPKNNFWLLYIDASYKYRDSEVILSTGPPLLSKVYARYSNLVHVLPSYKFNPRESEEHKGVAKTKHLFTFMW